MAVKTNSVDMIHGPLWGKILKFSLTFMLTAVLQELYNAADMLVVGRYAGQIALAGVGASGTIVNLLLNFILGVSAGVTIVVGQAIGENSGGIKKSVHTSIAIAVWGGLIASVVCFLFSKPLLEMTDVPMDVMPEANIYLKIIAIGFIPSLIYNFGAGILRAKGDAKRPLYIVLISGVINVALNLVFVCVFKMGAAGVATATVISQTFTAVSVMYILCTENDQTRIYFKELRIYKEPFLKILRFGLPSGIQSTVYTFSAVIVQSSVNGFGAAAIAGSAAGSSITNFYNVMVNSIYQAALVFTSQNYGAKRFDRILKIILVCEVYNVAIWGLQSVFTYFCGNAMVELYAPGQPEVIEMGLRKLKVLGYSYITLGIMNIMTGALRGMGASLMNMVTSIIGVCGIRIVWIFTVFEAFKTFETLFLCFPVSWIGTAVMHTIMFIYVFKKEKKKAALQAQNTAEAMV